MFWWYYWTGLASRCAKLTDTSERVANCRPRRQQLRARPADGLRLVTVDGVRVEHGSRKSE
jgi:hypothetical protein